MKDLLGIRAALAGLVMSNTGSGNRLDRLIWDALPENLRAVVFDMRKNHADALQTAVDLVGGPASPSGAALQSILGEADLGEPLPNTLVHRMRALEIGETIYPFAPPAGQTSAAFDGLLDGFARELLDWKKIEPDWEALPTERFLVTLLALMRKYTWCISTSAAQPGESLYENHRLVSALSACLVGADVLPVSPSDPAALLVRGGFSGIQDFIYRIARPEADTAHVSKRLRGRSFYVGLLSEVIANWILEKAGMPPNTVLFIGGGRFDLLVPLAREAEVQAFIPRIEDYLMRNFQGGLACTIVARALTGQDLRDMRQAYRDLDSAIEMGKLHKWSGLLSADFYQPSQPDWHACPVCHISAVSKPGQVCGLCGAHENLGKHLPYATHLVFCPGEGAIPLPPDRVVSFSCGGLTTRAALLRDPDEIASLSTSQPRAVLFSLNKTTGFIHPGIASSYRFLANTAARSISLKGPSQTGDMDTLLDFETISELSTGAKRLGVLKADVDHMGLLSSEGLQSRAGAAPTIGRMATLSSALDLFFSGEINRICAEVFKQWGSAHPDKAKYVDGLFYVVYSGGDDLFVIGPWDAVILLAQAIQHEFTRYSGNNPNLTLSAGIVQVKPRYPIHKFAELVDEAEQKSKVGGRNLVTLFNQTLPWMGENGLDGLKTLADDLAMAIQNKKIQRGVVTDLGEIYRQHLAEGWKTHAGQLMTPRLFYTLVRRIEPAVRQSIGPRILSAMKSGGILVPVSMVSLSLREE